MVGLCVERSPQLVVGLLAILEAGGAYLPLDPALPDERLRFMLADAGATAVVTQSHLRDRLGTTAAIVDIDQPLPAPSIQDTQVDTEVGPAHLAYVLYTSGSTGRPKGVAIEHRALTNLLQAMRREIDLTPADLCLATTTISLRYRCARAAAAADGGPAWRWSRADGWRRPRLVRALHTTAPR